MHLIIMLTTLHPSMNEHECRTELSAPEPPLDELLEVNVPGAVPIDRFERLRQVRRTLRTLRDSRNTPTNASGARMRDSTIVESTFSGQNRK
eukprot:COSAG06_NODE_21351_length_759_cov_169.019697_1_plen_92_part_00